MSLPRAFETRIPPPVITVTFGAAMWVLARYVSIGRFAEHPPWIAAIALFVLGFAVALWGVIAFRVHRTTVNPLRPEQASSLVTGGIYRITRNPMYLGMAILLVGWAVALAHLGTLPLVAAFVLTLTRVQIIPEERILQAKFGTEFEAYRRRVRRWI